MPNVPAVQNRRYPLRDRKPNLDPDMYYYAHFCEVIKDPVSSSEALSQNCHVVGSKWVYKLKKSSDGSTRYKARLVAQGYSQKKGIDYEETFSPTIPHSTIRLLFALSAKYNWKFYHLDVLTAFLNGELHEDVYLVR